MENDIQLRVKKSESVLKFKLLDEDGNDTGEYLQFDVEDMGSALRLQECLESHKRNASYIKNQLYIINKREDHKGKKLLSANEEAVNRAWNEFFRREMEALDLFIGKGKTQVILNIMGREPYMSMFEDITELIDPIIPVLEKAYSDFKNKIEEKYKDKGENILE